jgi:hypothetical protein
MTPDQARELEEWDAMGGNASKLIVNAATVRLEDLGVQNAQTQAPAGRQAADAGE